MMGAFRELKLISGASISHTQTHRGNFLILNAANVGKTADIRRMLMEVNFSWPLPQIYLRDCLIKSL